MDCAKMNASLLSALENTKKTEKLPVVFLVGFSGVDWKLLNDLKVTGMKHIMSGELTPDQINELSEKPWIKKIVLSKKSGLK